MVIAVFIVLCIAIGWAGPRLLVPVLPPRAAVILASVITLAAAAGAVWMGAQLFGLAGIEEAGSAFDRGFNAWKILLLMVPAVALHTSRQLSREKERT